MKWTEMSPLQNTKWTLPDHIFKTAFGEGFGGLAHDFFILGVSNNCLVTPKLRSWMLQLGNSWLVPNLLQLFIYIKQIWLLRSSFLFKLWLLLTTRAIHRSFHINENQALPFNKSLLVRSLGQVNPVLSYHVLFLQSLFKLHHILDTSANSSAVGRGRWPNTREKPKRITWSLSFWGDLFA